MLHLSKVLLLNVNRIFRYFSITFLSILFLSISAHSQVQKLYLHPKTVAREKQSKFVDSLRFIPLEAREDIRLGDHYNIEVTGKYFLLVDYMNKRLVVYTKAGNFVKAISYKKLGDSFYPSYREVTNTVRFFGNNKNYSLTPTDQIKIKLDWNNPRNLKYFKKYIIDLNDPSLTLKKEVPDEKDILQVNHLYADQYMQGDISVSPLYKDSIDYELKLYHNNQLAKTFFPYNRINEPRFLFNRENVGLHKTDTAHMYVVTRPFCDTIYKIIDDSLFATYKLVLPLENSLPASFFTKPFKNKTEQENFRRNNGWMLYQVYNFYENEKFIYLLIGYLSNAEAYVYDKQTAVTYKTKNIKSDTSQFNLQLLDTYGTMRKANKFYKPQTAKELISFVEEHKDMSLPEELEKFIASKPSATTPVVVEFTLKN